MLSSCGSGEDSYEPLDSEKFKPVNPKGHQSWIFTGRTEGWSSNTLATWCEEATHWKRPWCWERLRRREGMTEDEMAGWHHRLNGVNLSKLWEMVKDRGAWRVDIYSILSLWPLLLLVVNTHYSNGVDLLTSVEGQVENNGDWEGENIVSNMWEWLSFEKDQTPNILFFLSLF